uniref:Uncharacterized protein n=1 Tax=Oryza rufipogon TaxID=4529 RepID=A0A0E0QRF4_ORYRU
MAAVLTLRPTDCLRGGGGGVQCAAAAAAATDHPTRASKLARPPRRGGRANGRQPRGRGSSSHSHRAAAPRPSQSQSQMRAMEKVVILKRGDRFAPEIGAAVAVEAPAADQCGAAAAAAEEHAEPVTAAGQRVAPVKKAEPVAEADRYIAPAEMAPVQCVTPTKMDQPAVAAAAEQCISPANSAEPAVAAEQCIALAAAKIPRPVAVAVAAEGQRRATATKPKTSRVLYGGPSFVIPPDPSELPIPVLLLESRGRRSAACA